MAWGPVFLMRSVTALLACVFAAVAHAEEPSVIERLENGVIAILHPRGEGTEPAAVRVVWKRSPQEHAIFAYEADQWDAMGAFFEHCDASFNGVTRAGFCELGDYDAKEIAVIAVGNFDPKEMLDLIHLHFNDRVAVKAGVDPIAVYKSRLESGGVNLLLDYFPKDLARMDMQKRWDLLLLEELFQMRMQRCAERMQGMWSYSYGPLIYPTPGYAVISSQEDQAFMALLDAVEQIEACGFEDQELALAKLGVLGRLQGLSSFEQSHPNGFYAAYYTDQFIYSGSFPAYATFVEQSQQMIQHADLAQLLLEVPQFLADVNRVIQIQYPGGWTGAILDVADVKEGILRCANEILPVEPQIMPPVQVNTYLLLPLSDSEIRHIHYIITNMGEKNVFQLAFKKKEMEKRGKKIHHVHPMRFMGYIMSSSSLRKHIREIQKSSFKWDAFINGFSKRMREEASRHNLETHIAGFAEHVGVDRELVARYIHRKDYEGLVRFLAHR